MLIADEAKVPMEALNPLNTHLLRRYSIGAATVLLAILAVRLLHPWIGDRIPTVVLVPFVLGAAWYGGLTVGLVSTALHSIAAAYFLLPPTYSLSVTGRLGWFSLGVFVIQGILISWLCEAYRRTRAESSRVAAELELTRAEARDTRHQLRRTTADLNELARSLARDLETPLYRTLSSAHRLLGHPPAALDRESRDALMVIRHSADRMSEFVGSLADYANLETSAPGDATVDTAALLASVIEQCRPEIEASGASVSVAPGLPSISGCAPQLFRLFLNLVQNALKFHGDSPPSVQISCKEHKDSWIFAVADNGIGVVPARWEDAFTLFRRLNGDKYPGTGAGLAMCRRIAENLGGRIWMCSSAGQGTTVRVSIPHRRPRTGPRLLVRK